MCIFSSASYFKHVAMKPKPTSLIVLFCTLCQAFDNTGICETSSHDGLSTKQFCCDFYENITNGCVACKDGFESFQGSPCKPCSSNTFGNWCAEKCICTGNQRCDHINGCVDVITTVDLYQGTVTTWTTATQTETSRTDRSNDTLNEFPIYVAVGTGSIVINIILCSMYAVYYKRKRHSNHIFPNTARGPMEDAYIQEHAYDEIDDNAVTIEFPNQGAVINTHDKAEVPIASGASSEDVPGNDYLTPYQPIVNYPNAIYINLPLNSDIPHGSITSDRSVEYENTAIFN